MAKEKTVNITATKDNIEVEVVDSEIKKDNPKNNKPSNLNIKMNNTLLSKKIISSKAVEGRYSIEPLKNKKTKTFYTISYDESFENLGLSSFDNMVMDCVYSILKRGQNIITAQDIVREMTGMNISHITDKQVTAVRNSLLYLRRLQLNIDCGDELKARRLIKESKKIVIRGYMLSFLEEEIVYNNGKKNINYIFSKEISMPAYDYAEKVGQIISVPQHLLEAGKKSVKNTDENLLIKRALIKRIEVMRNPHNYIDNTKISYEGDGLKTGLFTECGILKADYSDKTWRKKKLTTRKVITDILSDYVKDGYIKNYVEYSAKNSGSSGKSCIAGVELFI